MSDQKTVLNGSTTQPKKADDAQFKRLLELKSLYDAQKRALGTTVLTGNEIHFASNLPVDFDSDEEPTALDLQIAQIFGDPKPTRDNGTAELSDDLSDYDDEADQQFDEHGKKLPRMSRSERATGVRALQQLIKNIIERNGGSCHLETIVEHVMMKWQRDKIKKPDGTLHGHQDCKKAVQGNFRTKIHSRMVFSRDKDREGCWVVTPEDENNPHPVYPLETCITDAIEAYSGTVFFEDIHSYVAQNWLGRKKYDGTEYTLPEMMLQINITLVTNPRFIEEDDMQDFYTLTNRTKKRRAGNDQQPEKKQKTANGVRGKNRDDEDEEEFGKSGQSSLEKKSTRRTGKPVQVDGPPPGYACKQCNSTSPGTGPNSKWKKMPTGEWFCHSDGILNSRKNACPVCGRTYKKNEFSFDNNAWIRCDDCHRWVMTGCDNIVDLSIYDDGNPNHLHYSCPECRGEDRMYSSKRENGMEEDEMQDEPLPTTTTNSTTPTQLVPIARQPTRIELFTKAFQEEIASEAQKLMIREPSIELKERIRVKALESTHTSSQMMNTVLNRFRREWKKTDRPYQDSFKKIQDERHMREQLLENTMLKDLQEFFQRQRKEFEQNMFKLREKYH